MKLHFINNIFVGGSCKIQVRKSSLLNRKKGHIGKGFEEFQYIGTKKERSLLA